MRRPSLLVVCAACSSLLGLQLSGLHLHVNVDGFDAVPHGTHVHGADAHSHDSAAAAAHDDSEPRDGVDDHHDHEGDRDVAILDPCAGTAKPPVFLVGRGLELLSAPPSAGRIRARSITPPPNAQGARWRPPLRGPPPQSV